MQPDYQLLLSGVVKKQIELLGPTLALSQARQVKALTINDDGTVTHIEGLPQVAMQALIENFVILSGMIVKKAIEPFLTPGQQQAAPSQGINPQLATQLPPTQTVNQPAPAPNPLAA